MFSVPCSPILYSRSNPQDCSLKPIKTMIHPQTKSIIIDHEKDTEFNNISNKYLVGIKKDHLEKQKYIDNETSSQYKDHIEKLQCNFYFQLSIITY